MASRRVKQIKWFTKFFKKTFKSESVANELIRAIKMRGALRDRLKAVGKVSRKQQAHHIIPVEAVKQCRLMQKAVLAKFDLNGAGNGIALTLAQHKRRHRELGEYNRYVMAELLHLESRLPKNISRERARAEVENLVSQLRSHFS